MDKAVDSVGAYFLPAAKTLDEIIYLRAAINKTPQCLNGSDWRRLSWPNMEKRGVQEDHIVNCRLCGLRVHYLFLLKTAFQSSAYKDREAAVWLEDALLTLSEKVIDSVTIVEEEKYNQ